MAEPGKDPVGDVKVKGQDFIAGAKAGTLTESQLKWGLSVGAIVSGVSLFLNYFDLSSKYGVVAHGFGRASGLDMLSHGSLEVLAIPLSALFALFLHFGEPSLKVLKMETPGRAKLIYLIAMIVAILGALGCLHFIRFQVLLGNVLGLVGIGLLAFVYFKLWQMSPVAEATRTPPSAPPPPPAGNSPPPGQ